MMFNNILRIYLSSNIFLTMNTLLIIGLFTMLVFFLIDKNILPGSIIDRKHIAAKLEKNKKRELQLQAEFEALISTYGLSSENVFPDSDITYSEYIDLLKEKASIEYSDTEFEKLKTKLKRNQVNEYIERIRNQEESVIAFQADIDYQKKNLQSLKAS